jgi:hypothetical protein
MKKVLEIIVGLLKDSAGVDESEGQDRELPIKDK